MKARKYVIWTVRLDKEEYQVKYCPGYYISNSKYYINGTELVESEFFERLADVMKDIKADSADIIIEKRSKQELMSEVIEFIISCCDIHVSITCISGSFGKRLDFKIDDIFIAHAYENELDSSFNSLKKLYDTFKNIYYETGIEKQEREEV